MSGSYIYSIKETKMKKIGIDIETSGVEYDAQLAGVSIYDPEQDSVQFYPTKK